jgi:two-component system, LytTR family, response regulator
MLKCIAIDDEPFALEVIKAHAKKVPFIELKETFVNAMEALEYLKKNTIDLVFLDINMPDITGLEFSQLLTDQQFIFTTAYSQYAVDAFTLQATDYLMKPIDFNRFLVACQKVYENITKEAPKMTHLFVKDGYDLVKVGLEDLLFVGSDGNYLTFKEIAKKTLTRMTMTEAIELLPKANYFRTHKSYLVNLGKVQKIEKHQLTLTDSSIVPLAANFRDDFLEAIKRF